MKHAKKIAAILLAVLLTFAMATTAFAAQEGSLTGGKITINNAVVGQKYNIYQLMYIESYNESAGTYTYKANSAWKDWLKTQTAYVSVDDQDYVTWVNTNTDRDTVQAFAKAALAYAKDNSIAANATEVTADTTTVEFTGLNLGYYLVDTTLGTLCSLNTTNPTATMEEKNAEPTLDKAVKEDSTGTFGASNTAQIGDVIDFQITIHAKKGAENYVLHDKLSAGLTLDANTIAVTGLTKDIDYTVKTTDLADTTCDFEITFTKTYLDSITTNTDIVVTYKAKLNKDAVIADAVNTNEATLKYGDASNTKETAPKQTTTKTFKFDIVKTDSNLKLLDGAKFKLYDAQTNGNEIAVVKNADGTYRVAVAGEAGVEIEATNGRATVTGLDNNTTYWLEETKAPQGYNMLAERVEVVIGEGNLVTTMTGDTWATGNGGVQITNNAGSLLPMTGGIGTTIIYVAGGAVILGALVLLIIRRRRQSREA